MAKKDIIDALDAVGCRSAEATCDHRASHAVGGGGKSGKASTTIIYCERYFTPTEKGATLREQPHMDPRYTGQPHRDELFDLPAFGAEGGRATRRNAGPPAP